MSVPRASLPRSAESESRQSVAIWSTDPLRAKSNKTVPLPLATEATQLLDQYLGGSTLAISEALEARRLAAVSINVRITSAPKLAVEAARAELASGIIVVKGLPSKDVRLGNWLTAKQAQAVLNAPDAASNKCVRDGQTTSREHSEGSV